MKICSGTIRELLSDGPVLLDGAWGTELQAQGLGIGEVPDFWNLSHPERVEHVARNYVDAGSRVVLTNTFRAKGIAQAEHSDISRLSVGNRLGVEISRQAAGGRAAVFASIGPSGKLLLTHGVDAECLRMAFDEQAQALASAAPDAIVIETMTDLKEAEYAIAAARATGLPVVACMVFDSGRAKDHTMMGVSPEEAAAALTELGVDVVGANCGIGVEGYVSICRRMALATELPVWIKANAGIPEIVSGEVVYRTTPDEYADHLEILIDAGASFVGGCCGTNPEFVAAMNLRLEKIKSAST